MKWTLSGVGPLSWPSMSQVARPDISGRTSQMSLKQIFPTVFHEDTLLTCHQVNSTSYFNWLRLVASPGDHNKDTDGLQTRILGVGLMKAGSTAIWHALSAALNTSSMGHSAEIYHVESKKGFRKHVQNGTPMDTTWEDEFCDLGICWLCGNLWVDISEIERPLVWEMSWRDPKDGIIQRSMSYFQHGSHNDMVSYLFGRFQVLVS